MFAMPEILYSISDEERAAYNKDNAVLYPKTVELPSGRLLLAFERSIGPVDGQTIPMFASDDHGETWHRLADVAAPASCADSPRLSRFTSNWTNPFLYVLPRQLGNLAAGTVLLATLVSDAVAEGAGEGFGNRSDCAIVLYASGDEGEHWRLLSLVATGRWRKANPSDGTVRTNDPIWEPYLMMRGDRLVCYYSDEHEYRCDDYDSDSGIVRPIPESNDTEDPNGQVLVHRTWDGVGEWGEPVADVLGGTFPSGEFGDHRPGMTTVAPTVDGKWLLTYEWFDKPGGDIDVHVRISDDPERFDLIEGCSVDGLPTSDGSTLAKGGSPVVVTLPDGRIVYNAHGSSSIWLNESGRSDGDWVEIPTDVPAGYSRNLQWVSATGRLLITSIAFGGSAITYGFVDLPAE